MRFTKMHGLGNDYIYINCFTETIKKPELLSMILSNRHTGIGADGLILIGPSEQADFRMQMYNADGSAAEMCGNGIRCVGKYVFEQGLTANKTPVIETKAGLKKLELIEENGIVTAVKAEMGSPVLDAEWIPVICNKSRAINETIIVGGREYRMTAVSMGNPHAVIYVNHVGTADVGFIGPRMEYHGRFPKRVNTEFAEVVDRHTVKVRVWERGSKETLACGTGACAVAVAGVLNDLTDRKVTVKLLGGDLTVEWDERTDKVFLTGTATHVFDGEVDISGIE